MRTRFSLSVCSLLVLATHAFGQIGDAEAMLLDVERNGYWVRGIVAPEASTAEAAIAEEPPAPVRILQLYPTNAERFIYLPGREDLVDVRVSDAAGRMVRSFGDMPGRAMLDISALQPGGYTITARSGDKFLLGRFTKP